MQLENAEQANPALYPQIPLYDSLEVRFVGKG